MKSNFLNQSIFSKVSLVDKLMFTKHLAVMLKSGIPLDEAILSLKNQTANTAFKKVLTDLYQRIENGDPLAKAASLHPEVFDPLYLSLLRIGEKSGTLEENLEYLSSQLKKIYEFGRKVQGALLYPEIVLAAALVMGISLSLFVLPQLVDLFHSLDVPLPLSTKILLFVAGVMKNYGIFIVGGLIILSVLIFLLLQQTSVKKKWQYLLLSLPFIGSLVQNIALTAVCRNIGMMLKSGLTITAALEAQIKATENLIYQEYLKNFLKAIDSGKKLSVEMAAGQYRFLPAIMPKMVGVGEETGKLEDTLLYLGDFFEEEVDDMTKNISNTLEPIMLLLIGLVVGFTALAIISPIYQLTSGIHR